MGFKPGFTHARLSGGAVSVGGKSDPDDLADIMEVRVVLAQGDNVARTTLAGVGPVWEAKLGGDFKTGPATAFGTETRKENFATISWVTPLKIE